MGKTPTKEEGKSSEGLGEPSDGDPDLPPAEWEGERGSLRLQGHLRVSQPGSWSIFDPQVSSKGCCGTGLSQSPGAFWSLAGAIRGRVTLTQGWIRRPAAGALWQCHSTRRESEWPLFVATACTEWMDSPGSLSWRTFSYSSASLPNRRSQLPYLFWDLLPLIRSMIISSKYKNEKCQLSKELCEQVL